jgi:hypothetical protein
MEWAIIILLVALIGYQFGYRRGHRRGQKLTNFKMLNEGFRSGKRVIEDEICLMKNFPDQEIVKRVKNFIRRQEN